MTDFPSLRLLSGDAKNIRPLPDKPAYRSPSPDFPELQLKALTGFLGWPAPPALTTTETILRANIPTTVITATTFTASGFLVEGDAGAGAIYTANGAGPSGPMAVQDLHGTWFKLVLNGEAHIGWFGAKGDGVTSDAAAIQAAHDAAFAHGGDVFLGPYTYAINTGLVWQINVGIHGRGRGQTVLKATAAILMLNFTGISAGHDPAPMEDVFFDGNSVAKAGVLIGGFAQNFYVKSLRVDNCLHDGIILCGAQNGVYINLFAQGCGVSNLRLAGGNTHNNSFYRCNVNGPGSLGYNILSRMSATSPPVGGLNYYALAGNPFGTDSPAFGNFFFSMITEGGTPINHVRLEDDLGDNTFYSLEVDGGSVGNPQVYLGSNCANTSFMRGQLNTLGGAMSYAIENHGFGNSLYKCSAPGWVGLPWVNNIFPGTIVIEGADTGTGTIVDVSSPVRSASNRQNFVAGAYVQEIGISVIPDADVTRNLGSSGNRWNALYVGTVHTDGIVNVRYFGATGDGITDDSTAIHNAVNAAYTSNCAVYFPTGRYRITQDAVLTQSVDTAQHGLKYFGDGEGKSVLVLDVGVSSTDMYFYNNGSTPRQANNFFVDLDFVSTFNFSVWSAIPDHANGFRFWASVATGGDGSRNFFTRCRIYGLNNAIVTAGDEGTDTLSFNQCNISWIKNNVIQLNNIQSVVHSFFSTNIEIIFGDMFYVNGGGGISVFGGSLIPFSDRGTDTYLFNTTNSAGPNDMPIVFNGVRVELRGNFTNLFAIDDFVHTNVSFVDSALLDQSGIAKPEWGFLGPYSTVSFTRCTFNENFDGAINFDIGSNNLYGQSGRLVFQSCALLDDWSERCNVPNFGGVSVRDCYNTDVGAHFDGFHYANDFDTHFGGTVGLYSVWSTSSQTGASLNDLNFRSKFAYLLMNGEVWSRSDPTNPATPTLRLPVNAIIKSIHIRKAPDLTTDATAGAWTVSNANKTVTHLASAATQHQFGIEADVSDYFYMVGNVDNERNIILYFDIGGHVAGGSGFAQGGFVIVEYI